MFYSCLSVTGFQLFSGTLINELNLIEYSFCLWAILISQGRSYLKHNVSSMKHEIIFIFYGCGGTESHLRNEGEFLVFLLYWPFSCFLSFTSHLLSYSGYTSVPRGVREGTLLHPTRCSGRLVFLTMLRVVKQLFTWGRLRWKNNYGGSCWIRHWQRAREEVHEDVSQQTRCPQRDINQGLKDSWTCDVLPLVCHAWKAGYQCSNGITSELLRTSWDLKKF